VDCISKNKTIKDKIKQTNLKRYDVGSPIQNIDIYEKLLKSSFRTKKYKTQIYIIKENMN